MLAVAQGQSGSTTAPNKGTEPTVAQEQQPARSIYHDCLVAAGKSTWAELGLNSDQVDRVTALQATYKSELAALETGDGKAKASKKEVVSEKKAATPVKPVEPLDKSGIKGEDKTAAPTKEPMDKTGVSEERTADGMPTTKPVDGKAPVTAEEIVDPTLPPMEQDKTATQFDAAPADEAGVPVINDAKGSELAAILTPEQWNRWQKQCAATARVGMIEP